MYILTNVTQAGCDDINKLTYKMKIKIHICQTYAHNSVTIYKVMPH